MQLAWRSRAPFGPSIPIAATGRAQRFVAASVRVPQRLRIAHPDCACLATVLVMAQDELGQRSLTSLFDEALRHPEPIYAFGELLARANPRRALVEVHEGLFDVMRWMSRRDEGGLLPVALEQLELLRAQMASVPSDEPPPEAPGPEIPPWIRYSRRRRF